MGICRGRKHYAQRREERCSLAPADSQLVLTAAVLGIQYRKLPHGSYNHSSIVTLLTPDGEIAVQSSALGKADPDVLAALIKITQPISKAPVAR